MVEMTLVEELTGLIESWADDAATLLEEKFAINTAAAKVYQECSDELAALLVRRADLFQPPTSRDRHHPPKTNEDD